VAGGQYPFSQNFKPKSEAAVLAPAGGIIVPSGAAFYLASLVYSRQT
jgi:hypothetical protein